MTPRPLKVDLHIHTNHSKDSRASPEAMVKRALELGFDAIAVTDHNTVSGSLEAERLAEGTGLLVIPGQETLASEGELITLGLRETLPSGRTVRETAGQARKAGGFVIAPHPFDPMRRGLGRAIEPCLKHMDAIEVFNARTIFRGFNNKALSFAREHGLPMVAGSDSHFPEEMGAVYMLVRAPMETRAIFEAIRLGQAELFASSQPMKPRIKRGLMKIRTYF
jgi:predicted metal-dependent phosphoesterase TrpH